MEGNIIVKILENQEKTRKENVKLSEWGMLQRSRLVSVLESAGATITNHVWDLLLFNVNGLRINQAGKVCYLSFYPESKKISLLLNRYSSVIKENFDYITKV